MRVIALMFLILSTGLFAQDALKVMYGNQLKFAMPEQAKSYPKIKAHYLKMSEEIKDYEFIYFNQESTYQLVEKISNQQTEDSSFSSSISVGGGESYLRYTNYNTGTHYRKANVRGKETYIKGDLRDFDWVLTRDTKNILGIEVRKATYVDGESKGIAWYAPEIPYKAGPLDISGLPGLILEYERLWDGPNGINSEIIFAQEIEFLDANTIKITQPKDSKSISQEEYNIFYDEQQQKLKEMISQGVDTSN